MPQTARSIACREGTSEPHERRLDLRMRPGAFALHCSPGPMLPDAYRSSAGLLLPAVRISSAQTLANAGLASVRSFISSGTAATYENISSLRKTRCRQSGSTASSLLQSGRRPEVASLLSWTEILTSISRSDWKAISTSVPPASRIARNLGTVPFRT